MPISTIRFSFEGMLLLFLNDDREYCDVGLLSNVHHHQPEILITRTERSRSTTILFPQAGQIIADRLFLNTNRSQQRVRLQAMGLVNLEGNQVYGRRLEPGLALQKLRPILRIYDGTFFAQPPFSDNKLTVTKPSGVTTDLGLVATRIGAEIALESEETASFFNGPDSAPTPLPAVENVDYNISMTNKRQHGPSAEIDAENYHLVVANHIPPFRRVTFGRSPAFDKTIVSTPDAVCLPGWMGTTELP